MVLKILSTTDGKHKGEKFEVAELPQAGYDFAYRDIVFEVTNIKRKGDYVTIYCSNYVVITKEV